MDYSSNSFPAPTRAQRAFRFALRQSINDSYTSVLQILDALRFRKDVSFICKVDCNVEYHSKISDAVRLLERLLLAGTFHYPKAISSVPDDQSMPEGQKSEQLIEKLIVALRGTRDPFTLIYELTAYDKVSLCSSIDSPKKALHALLKAIGTDVSKMTSMLP